MYLRYWSFRENEKQKKQTLRKGATWRQNDVFINSLSPLLNAKQQPNRWNWIVLTVTADRLCLYWWASQSKISSELRRIWSHSLVLVHAGNIAASTSTYSSACTCVCLCTRKCVFVCVCMSLDLCNVSNEHRKTIKKYSRLKVKFLSTVVIMCYFTRVHNCSHSHTHSRKRCFYFQ